MHACVRLLALLAFALLPFVGSAAAEVAIPPLNGRVVDQAHILSSSDRAQVEAMAAALEHEKGAQVVVLTVPTTAPETIEQFGIRVAESWKIGRKGVDDGVILIIAANDRSVRIEVGYGLEGAIPDAIARRIIDEQLIPAFREGDFGGGTLHGVDALIRAIRKEPLPPPLPSYRSQHRFSSGTFANLLIVLLALGPAAGQVLKAILGELGGSLIASLIAAGISAMFLPLWLALALGIAIFLVVLFSVGMDGLLPYGSRSYRGGSGGFGRGGGFSGGGGGFGGGGASGRW